MSWFTDVLNFHGKMRSPIGEGMTVKVLRRRRALMDEEWKEVCHAFSDYERYSTSRYFTKSAAITENYLKQICAELVDLMYVTLGTFAEAGIDPKPVWDAVHAANMEKEPHPDGGKPVKGEKWQKPNIVLFSIPILPQRIAGFDPNQGGIQSRGALPAGRVTQAIGQPLERSPQPRTQVGRASDTLPERKSNSGLGNCYLCGKPRTAGGGCEGNC